MSWFHVKVLLVHLLSPVSAWCHQEAAVSLVVDTAGGLGATLGPGYIRYRSPPPPPLPPPIQHTPTHRAVARRDAVCPGVRILQLNLRDENSQKLEEEVTI